MSLDLDRLLADLEESTDLNWSLDRATILALIAELRASRKVVEAARAFPISNDQYNAGDDEPLDAALAEYDSLVNARSEEAK